MAFQMYLDLNILQSKSFGQSFSSLPWVVPFIFFTVRIKEYLQYDVTTLVRSINEEEIDFSVVTMFAIRIDFLMKMHIIFLLLF